MPQTIPSISNGPGDTRPDANFLLSDNSFHADCGSYVSQLLNGQHGQKWLKDAMAAHDRRLNGEFDAQIREKFTDEWNEEWPQESPGDEEEEEGDAEED